MKGFKARNCNKKEKHISNITVKMHWQSVYWDQTKLKVPERGCLMSQKKILIIDDEHTLLRLSQIIFQRKGFQVFVSLSVKEAKSILSVQGTLDAIVLDLMMPEENGFDFLRWKMEQPDAVKNIPVIVNTAKSLTEEDKDFLDKTSKKIMQKGINFADKLVSEVEDLFK